MIGFIYAIIAAVLFAGREGLNKKLTRKTGIYFILWAATLFALPLFLIGLLYEGLPEINNLFWLALTAATPLFLVSSLILIRAEQISPLSLTLPFLAFTPVLMILTSWVMLGEMPSTWGIIGITLVPLGAFLLNIKQIDHGILAPIKAIKTEKGSLYALAVATIWSITANIDKIAIQNASVFFYLFIINLNLSIILTFILAYRYKHTFFHEAKKNLKLFITVGFINGLASILQMMALQKILAPYVIAIKRAGLVLGGIIIGSLIFKEKEFKQHLIGGLVMTAGVLLILLFH